MKNKTRGEDTFEVAATRNLNPGDGHLVGSLFGVSINTRLSGAMAQFERTGAFDLACAATQTFTVGQPVYWDNTNFVVTAVSTSNKMIGVTTAAYSSAATVNVLLGYAN